MPIDDVPDALDGNELAKRLGVSVRTLRSWMQARALPRPPARGHLTRFDRRLIVIAHAVAALRRDGVPLANIPRFLANKGERELREIGGLPPVRSSGPPPALPPPRTAHALPSDASSRNSETEYGAHLRTSVVSSDELARSGRLASRDDEHSAGIPAGAVWRRIELLPGLEIHMREDASAFVHGIVAAIMSGRFGK
jgi:DNA-binding transcriptional MerR regulator